MTHRNAITVCFALFVMTAMLLSAGTANAAPVDNMGGWSHIDQSGNADDVEFWYSGTPKELGGVDYEYKIARHAVSIDNWAKMEADTSYSVGGNYDYWDEAGQDEGTAAPATKVSMYQASAYANWLTTGDPDQGVYDPTWDGTDGNSNVSGWDSNPVARGSSAMDTLIDNNNGTVYAITTEDEWYKAAYYSLDESSVGSEKYYEWADGSDTAPTAGDSAHDEWNYKSVLAAVRNVGRYGLEQNKTRNMMGNVFEWMQDEDGITRGGHYDWGNADALSPDYRWDQSPTDDTIDTVGFRIVAIPEPASGLLFVFAGGLLWFGRRRRVRA